MKTKLFIFSLTCIFLFSCNHKKDNRISLVLHSSETTLNDTRFAYDSLVFDYQDSIYISRYFPQRNFENTFYRSGNNVYEYFNDYDELQMEYIGLDSILTFSLNDTIFLYIKEDKIVATVLDLSFASTKFEIKGDEKGNRITTKSSLLDSTYSETYYYDKDFRITKFVHTYQDNKCVYVPKR